MQKPFYAVLRKNYGFFMFILCMGVGSAAWGELTPYYGWIHFFDKAVLEYLGSASGGSISADEYIETLENLSDQSVDGSREYVIEGIVNVFISHLEANLTNSERPDALQYRQHEFDVWVQQNVSETVQTLKDVLLNTMGQGEYFERLRMFCKEYREKEGARAVVVEYGRGADSGSELAVDYKAIAEAHQKYDEFVRELNLAISEQLAQKSSVLSSFKNPLDDRMREVALQSFNGCQILEIYKFQAVFGRGYSAPISYPRALKAGGVPLWFRLDKGKRGGSQKKISLFLHQCRPEEGEGEEWPETLNLQFFTAGNFSGEVPAKELCKEVKLNKSPVPASKGASAVASTTPRVCDVIDFVSVEEKSYLTGQSMLLGVVARGVWSKEK